MFLLVDAYSRNKSQPYIYTHSQDIADLSFLSTLRMPNYDKPDPGQI